MNNEERLKALEEIIKGRYAQLIRVQKHSRALIKEPHLSHYWQGKSIAIDERANTDLIDPRVMRGFADEIDGYTGELSSLEKMLEVLK